MRDGVKIAIDLYLPEGLPEGEKIPAILWQTRYWRAWKLRWPFSLFAERDLEVTGHPIATLYLKSTAVDGVFIAYLEDVDEKGGVTYVTEGVLRGVHRKLSHETPPYPMVVPYHSFERADGRPMAPGEVAELVFDLLPTSYLFKQGHSIRIALAGADRDHFALIPSEGPPTWTVLRDAAHPSHVSLPVVPR
jgi:putative CocE/NonD family hydrolase